MVTEALCGAVYAFCMKIGIMIELNFLGSASKVWIYLSFSYSMNNTKKALALAAVVIVALVGYKVAMTPKGEMETTKLGDTTGAPVATPPVSMKKLSTQVTYKEPAGESKVGFLLTVSDGVITDAQAEVLATNPDSQRIQGDFQQAFPAAVRGKQLAELSAIDRVGGASLTTKAFNEALATLKAQM